MRSTTLGSFLVCAAALAAPAAGQTPAAAPPITRTVLASTKLPMVGDTPVHFRAVRVTIAPAASSSVSSTNGILYQLSGSTQELYRTTTPLPGLKPGRYDLSLTRVSFPARMPSNSPHHRSGAALYYILSGTGANTVGDKIEARTAGSLIYEPFDLVHQWGNPGDVPLTFLAFNINPDGVAAVLPGAPAKSP
jgi:mannose-6-phosphate isomerase-like protein (cupin superfamily)